MAQRDRCTIVIPTWNAGFLVERCLRSLKDHGEAERAEIVVVDDGGTDDTAERTWAACPDAVLVRHDGNRGFAAACNTGVSRASRDVVVLLNNDVVVTGPFLDPLLSHFRDERVFAVNPRVYQAGDGRPGGGLVRGVMHCGLLRLRWAEREFLREGRALTLYANGAAMAVSRSKYLALGGFDTLYAPFYSEDLDLSYRAYQRGWTVLYEPESRLTHEHGATIGARHDRGLVERVSTRNRILFVWRNVRDRRYLASHAFWMMARSLGAVLKGDLNFPRALLDAARHSDAVRTRRRSDPEPVVSDREILGSTSGWADREKP
ncbi:MAG: glycosyltransferase [Gemmatimonadetes bacterium]|nr:glycosyltransferase [Gemmatimonadota bacterium]